MNWEACISKGITLRAIIAAKFHIVCPLVRPGLGRIVEQPQSFEARLIPRTEALVPETKMGRLAKV